MDIDVIKGISLVDFLHHLGYVPTGRVCGIMPRTAMSADRHSMYDQARVYGTISAPVRAATYSPLRENCQENQTSSSRQNISPKR